LGKEGVSVSGARLGGEKGSGYVWEREGAPAHCRKKKKKVAPASGSKRGEGPGPSMAEGGVSRATLKGLKGGHRVKVQARVKKRSSGDGRGRAHGNPSRKGGLVRLGKKGLPGSSTAQRLKKKRSLKKTTTTRNRREGERRCSSIQRNPRPSPKGKKKVSLPQKKGQLNVQKGRRRRRPLGGENPDLTNRGKGKKGRVSIMERRGGPAETHLKG